MAQQEAANYRAGESLAHMRDTVIDRHTARDAKSRIDDIRRTIRPSSLKTYERFVTALAQAGGEWARYGVLCPEDLLAARVEVQRLLLAVKLDLARALSADRLGLEVDLCVARGVWCERRSRRISIAHEDLVIARGYAFHRNR